MRTQNSEISSPRRLTVTVRGQEPVVKALPPISFAEQVAAIEKAKTAKRALQGNLKLN